MIFYLSTNKLKKITGSADALNDEVLRIGLYQAQTALIVPLLGLELSTYIGVLITNNLVIDEYETLVVDYLQPILAWQALSNAVEPNNSNSMVSLNQQTDITNTNDTKLNRDHYRWISESYIRLAKNYLCNVTFPYYEQRTQKVDGNFMGVQL